MAKKRDLEGNRLHHFELSDANRTVRWVLIIVLLVVAAVSLTAGLTSALRTPDGWQTVSGSTTGLNCGDSFALQYEYGAGELSATAESKTLQPLYGKALEDAWKLFFNEAGSTDLTGLYALNQQPNQKITVDSGLYAALEQVVKLESRAIYLAPVYAEYDRVFNSQTESEAREHDPGQNEQQSAYIQALADFAKDPQAIGLVLDGNNTVTLQVSGDYLTFAETNEIRYFLDFGWLRNAFIADYIATILTANGFTNGYIASADGFTRNLSRQGDVFSLNLFNRDGNDIELAAVMNYTAPQSLIVLRNYPMYQSETSRYYSFSDGRILTTMIDPADGQSKSALNNLVSYSETLSCAELAMSVMPVYVADTFSEDALNTLAQQEIYSVWFSGKQLMHNEEDLNLTPYTPYEIK